MLGELVDGAVGGEAHDRVRGTCVVGCVIVGLITINDKVSVVDVRRFLVIV